MAMCRIPTDWDADIKQLKALEKQITDEDIEKSLSESLTPREIYDTIISGKFNVTLNYPGGIEQFIKDYESGKYDEK